MRAHLVHFRRLLRHFLAAFVENDLISPAEDLHGPIAGVLAVLLVLFAAVALLFLGKYDSVQLQVHGTFLPAQFQSLAEKMAMALDDKTLLLGGAMIVMALLTVIFWDSLTLDERDRAVLAPLPLRPALVLLAKGGAIALVAGVTAVALNILPAVLFPIVVLAKVHVSLATVLRWTCAHAAAGLAGCVFVFLMLSSLRGLAGLVLSNRVSRRLLPIVQFVAILALLSLLLALPLLAAQTRSAVEAGSAFLAFYPPLWFLGIEEVLIGRTETIFTNLARYGLTGLAASVFAACAVHVAALAVRSHPGVADAAGSGRITRGLLRRLASLVAPDGRARASFLMTAYTLARSRSHRVYLAGALGIGFAVAGATIGAAYGNLHIGRTTFDLTSMALAAQLNLIFFLVVGIRMSAAIPADLDAGWVFRFHATPALERHLAGTRAAIFCLTVAPILLVLAPVHAWLWGWYAAAVHLAFGVVAALGLLEVVFTGCTKLPFVSALTPGRMPVSLRFPLYVFDYLLFVYVTPALEQVLIRRSGMFYAWIALFVVVVVRFVSSQRARLRLTQMPVFEGQENEFQRLGLENFLGTSTIPVSGTAGSQAAHGCSDAFASRALFSSLAYGHRSSVDLHASHVTWDAILRRATLVWTGFADNFRADVVRAARRLRANPGFTLFSVVTLALGIGATIGIYSVLYSTLLKPLDVRGRDRLVNLYHSNPFGRGSRPNVSFSLPDFEDLRKTQTVFSAVAGHAPFAQVVVAGGTGERALGEAVIGDYFPALGIQPAAGRLLQPADDRPGAPRVTVIADRFWRRRFHGSSDAIGATIRMSGHDFQIVGVAPASFHGLELPNLAPTAVWIPVSAASAIGVRIGDDREERWLLAIGRLASGRTVEQASAEIALIGHRLDEAYPIGQGLPSNLRSPYAVRRAWMAVPAARRLVNERSDWIVVRLVRLTMVAVCLVLLVACTNIANLALARGSARQREFAVRRALGASRWQVIREQLVESAIVGALGALTAIAAARALMIYHVSATVRLGPWVSVDIAPTLDLRVTCVALAAAVLAVCVFGVIPALRLTTMDVAAATAGHSHAGLTPKWTGRRLLIASQVAISVALVAIAGLCVRQFAQVASRDTGLDLDRLALVRFDFDIQGWPEARARRALDRLLGELDRQDGIDAIALASGLPVARPATAVANLATTADPFNEPAYRGQRVTMLAVTPPAFKVFGVPIARGRSFDDRDDAGSQRVAVLSELAARDLFGTTDVVGRQILSRTRPWEQRADSVRTLTIVGVAADTDSGELGQRTEGVAYVPFAQQYDPSVAIIARTSLDPARALAAIQALASRMEPELGVIDAGTGNTIGGVENVAFEIMWALTGTLGLLALVLAMTGLYGVLSYAVAQRTQEMGVRVALGASASHIMRLVIADGVRPVVEGLVVGFVIADLVQMAMRPAFVKPLPAIDSTLLLVVPLPFLAAALLASYLPSRRAARVDPGVTLRQT
jgi:putative ABC transport system permease protein